MGRLTLIVFCTLLLNSISHAENLTFAEETPIIVTPEYAEDNVHQEYICRNGDLIRRVELVYLSDLAIPCEVRYFKESEAPGSVQILWSAETEEGFCEAKTQAFVEKLVGWGWQCNATEVAAAI